MKYKAKDDFEAIRVSWENVLRLRNIFRERLLGVVFSEKNSEKRLFFSFDTPGSADMAVAEEGDWLLFGKKGSINMFSDEEFQANFEADKGDQ